MSQEERGSLSLTLASPSRFRWGLLILAFGVLIGSKGHATALDTGRGRPDLTSWCRLDWNAGCATGLTVLSESGLALLPGQGPPPSSYELSLKLIPSRSMMFLFESPSTIGKISFSVDGVLIHTMAPVATGSWWVRLSGLPDTGILRLSLDKYCEGVTIESISYKCQDPLPADCRGEFILGMVAGALLAFVICWLSVR